MSHIFKKIPQSVLSFHAGNADTLAAIFLLSGSFNLDSKWFE